MGTNYYLLKSKHCEHCGHTHEDRKHLGKSSVGWKFLFQADAVTNFLEVTQIPIKYPDYKIIDEYDREMTHIEFLEMVMRKQIKAPAYDTESYYRDVIPGTKKPDNFEYYCDWGFRFCKQEFS